MKNVIPLSKFFIISINRIVLMLFLKIKNNFFIFYILFFISYPINLLAQDGADGTDSRLDEQIIYDRSGNSFSLREISLPSYNLSGVGSGVNTCDVGFFHIEFTDPAGTGFNNSTNGTNMRSVVCQVFTDLTQLIIPANNPYTGASNQNNHYVNIEIGYVSTLSSGVIATGGPYLSDLAPTGFKKGIIDGEVYRSINGGIDSWLPENILYGLSFFHGKISFNANNFPPNVFYTDLTTTTVPSNQRDLYAITLHEAIHALGFFSLINDQNGNSIFFNSQYYSRFDMHLVSNGNQVINSSTSCANPINYNSSANLTNGCSVFRFVGTGSYPVFAPSSFQQGSSLSHFDDVNCTSSSTFIMRQTYNPNITRRPSQEEVNALCDIGYHVTNQFGTNSANVGAYYSTYVSCGSRIAGVDDIFQFNTTLFYNYYQGQANPIIINDFLQNDEDEYNTSLNIPTGFICPTILVGGGTVTILSNTSISYIPLNTFIGWAIIRYIPKDISTGKLGNFAYIFIHVSNTVNFVCDPSNCNLVGGGDFEQVPLTDLHLSAYSNFNINGQNTPDLMGWNGTQWTSPGGGILYPPPGCGPISWTVPPSYNGTPSNNKYVGFGAHLNFSTGNQEAITLPLCRPIISGCKYTLHFWGMIKDISCPSVTGIFGLSPSAPCLPPIITNVSGGINSCTNPSFVVTTIASQVVSNPSPNWAPFDINFTYTGPSSANWLIVYTNLDNAILFIDDISITENVDLTTIPPVINDPCLGNCNGIINITAQSCNTPLTYSWSNSSTTEDISNLCAGTYTVTVTGTNNCTSTQSFLLVNNPGCTSFSISKVANVTTTFEHSDVIFTISICNNTSTAQNVLVNDILPDPSVFVLLNGTGSPYPANPFPNHPTNIVLQPGCTDFIVTGYYKIPGSCPNSLFTNTVSLTALGINYSASACVSVICPNSQSCCVNFTNTIGQHEFDNNTLPLTGTFNLNSDIILTRNVTLNGCTLAITKGVKITIPSGYSLTIDNNSVLFACNNMWQGIILEGGGFLYIQGGSFIYDAENAIYSNSGGEFHLNEAYFFRNYYSIKLLGGNFITSSIEQHCAFDGTQTLHFPHTGQTPELIHLENVELLRIGNSSTLANIFTGGRYGIYGWDCSGLNVVNNIFQSEEAGVYFISAWFYSGGLHYNWIGDGTLPTNIFLNNRYGVKVINQSIVVQRNDFDNCTNGISLETSSNQYGSITENEITNTYRGITSRLNKLCEISIANNTIQTIDDIGAVGITVDDIKGFDNYMGSYNNTITSYGSGIIYRNSNWNWIKENTIYLPDATTTARYTDWGIRLENCRNATTYCNSILGDQIDINHNNKSGISATFSPDCDFDCNSIDQTMQGLEFIADCNNALIKGNSMYYNGHGLLLGAQFNGGLSWSTGIIGDQTHFIDIYGIDQTFGNRFIGNAGTGQFLQSSMHSINSNGHLFQFWIDNSNYPPLPPFTSQAVGTYNSSLVFPFSPIDPALGHFYVCPNICASQPRSFRDETNIEQYLQAIMNLPNGNDEYTMNLKWALDQNLASAILKDTTVLDSMPDLQQFYDTVFTSSAGKFVNVKKEMELLNDSSVFSDPIIKEQIIQEAEAKNSSVSGVKIFEVNRKTINEIILATIARSNYEFSEPQKAMVEEIAFQCPYIGGSAVFEARAILSLWNDAIYFDDNDYCFDGAYFRTKRDVLNLTIEDHLIVFPNPTSQILNVDFGWSKSRESLSLIVRNSTGMEISSQDLIGQSGFVKLDLSYLLPSIYTIEVGDNKNIFMRKKFVIIK